MKRFSIIIPVFNTEKYLSACLDSVIHQTYHELDIIIINDGSTDSSAQIASQYAEKDSRIRLYHQPNLGPSAARNYGLQQARGEYIQFIDADDVIKPNVVAKLSRICEMDVDLIIFGYEQGKQKWSIPVSTGQYSKSQLMHHIGLLYKEGLLASPCNKLYKRTIITENQLQFPEDKTYGEDLLFNLSYITNCKHVYLYDAVLYVYRKHEESLTNSYIPHLFQKQKQLQQKMRQFLEENGVMTKANDDFLMQAAAAHCLYVVTNVCTAPDSESLRGELDEVLKDSETKTLLPYLNQGIQARFYRFFIRYETTTLAYVFFKMKKHVKEVIWWRK